MKTTPKKPTLAQKKAVLAFAEKYTIMKPIFHIKRAIQKNVKYLIASDLFQLLSILIVMKIIIKVVKSGGSAYMFEE